MFTHRLTETSDGYKIVEIESGKEVFRSSDSLPVAEMFLPQMYEKIRAACGISHEYIEDGHTGNHI